MKLEMRVKDVLEQGRRRLQAPIVLEVIAAPLGGTLAYVLPVKIGAVRGTLEAALCEEFGKPRWRAKVVDGYVVLPSAPPEEYGLIRFKVTDGQTTPDRRGNQYMCVGLRQMLADKLLEAREPLSVYQLRQMLEAEGVDKRIKNLKGRVHATLCSYPEFYRVAKAQYVHASRKKEFSGQ